jgi:alpha-ketoglutarate-dependent taurine dioxygenase
MRQSVTGPCAWTAAQMRASDRWIYTLTDEDRQELRDALAVLQTKSIPFDKTHFPLGLFAEQLRHMRDEVEAGSGVMLMRGFPLEEWDLATARQVYWGIGAHLGTALAQNARGDLLGEVTDRGGNPNKDPTTRGYHTAHAMPFHNDYCDVVGLLCVRRSKSGGLSCVASAAAVHNRILAERPDILEALYGPWYSDARGEQPAGRPPYYLEPRYAVFRERLYTHHGNTYLKSAQRFAEVPRLTDLHHEAVAMIDRLCASDEFRLDMDFRPGDIQFLNNRVVLHSRTDFVDFEEPDRKRLLLRLWLRTPGYAELPEFMVQRFEDMDHWLRHPVAE